MPHEKKGISHDFLANTSMLYAVESVTFLSICSTLLIQQRMKINETLVCEIKTVLGSSKAGRRNISSQAGAL